MRVSRALLVCTLLLAAAACGRKGPLDAPEGATTKDSNAEQQVPVNQRRDLPGGINDVIDSHGGAGP